MHGLKASGRGGLPQPSGNYSSVVWVYPAGDLRVPPVLKIKCKKTLHEIITNRYSRVCTCSAVGGQDAVSHGLNIGYVSKENGREKGRAALLVLGTGCCAIDVGVGQKPRHCERRVGVIRVPGEYVEHIAPRVLADSHEVPRLALEQNACGNPMEMGKGSLRLQSH